MSRGKKLLIAGLVLVVGFSLAWPFRKTTTNHTRDLAAGSLTASPSSPKITSRTSQPIQQSPMSSPAPHVVAKMTSLGDQETVRHNSPPTASFDLANHPALSTPLAPLKTFPVTPAVPPQDQTALKTYQPAQTQRYSAKPAKKPTEARPAYNTTDPDRTVDERDSAVDEVRHVVQNYDTLERLAKRYLGDEARALEIFDLNRDVLDNPHLLPIAAELRIPPRN